MLYAYGYRLTDRQSRLLCCALCREAWPILRDEASRKAVVVGEAYADDDACKTARLDALSGVASCGSPSFVMDGQLAVNCVMPNGFSRQFVVLGELLGQTLRGCPLCLGGCWYCLSWAPHRTARGFVPVPKARQMQLLKDLVGDPFLTAENEGLSAATRLAAGGWHSGLGVPWMTRDVKLLAASAYNDRLRAGNMDPVTLLALADAMEEAGAPDRLTHPLREDGRKYRGFWVVDIILGKY
jgi:hypothetical protein